MCKGYPFFWVGSGAADMMANELSQSLLECDNARRL